jgi:hypothetical protein
MSAHWPVNRPLSDLTNFCITMASDINDLPITSPQGSDFAHEEEILGLASDPNVACGTATAHRLLTHDTDAVGR